LQCNLQVKLCDRCLNALSVRYYNKDATMYLNPRTCQSASDIMLLDLFFVRFFINFSVCRMWWTQPATRQLFTAR